MFNVFLWVTRWEFGRREGEGRREDTTGNWPMDTQLIPGAAFKQSLGNRKNEHIF